MVAIPIALPLIMQVTTALGAGRMASEFNAVITSLPALQDLCAMSVLCSDKTGTLTSANISIIADQVFTVDGFSREVGVAQLMFACDTSDWCVGPGIVWCTGFEQGQEGGPNRSQRYQALRQIIWGWWPAEMRRVYSRALGRFQPYL